MCSDGVVGCIVDSTGQNDATANNFQDGGGGTTDAVGKIGGGVLFESGAGADDYIRFPADASRAVGTTYSVFAWAKPQGVSSWNAAHSIFSSNYNTDLTFRGDDSSGPLGLRGMAYRANSADWPSYDCDDSLVIWKEGQWDYVGMTVNGTDVRVYENSSRRPNQNGGAGGSGGVATGITLSSSQTNTLDKNIITNQTGGNGGIGADGGGSYPASGGNGGDAGASISINWEINSDSSNSYNNTIFDLETGTGGAGGAAGNGGSAGSNGADGTDYSMKFDSTSGSNLAYYNNLTSSVWVSNSDSTNDFNTTIDSKGIGNIYYTSAGAGAWDTYDIIDTDKIFPNIFPGFSVITLGNNPFLIPGNYCSFPIGFIGSILGELQRSIAIH